MKQLGIFVILIALLSLGPAAFAADSDVPAPGPGDSSRAGTEARTTPRHPDTDQDWHGGELRQPGAYMGQDGVLHHIPALQDPRLKIN
jgi:hypothetical protein